MPRRTLIALLLGCLAMLIIVVTVILVLCHQQEPQYDGRTLSEWLAQNGNAHRARSSAGGSDPQEAIEAVRHIGTNALPFLVKWMSYETPAWRRQLAPALLRLWPNSRRNASVLSLLGAKREESSWQALSAFEILGPEASPAVPDLERMMKNSKATPTWNLATLALGYIGKDGLPALIAALSDPSQSNRWRIIGAIGSIRNLDSNDRRAVVVLIKYLNDSDALLATTAARSLGSLALQPDLVVPALTKVFEDPKSRLRLVSALSLGKFGEQARPAVPALLEALRDPDRVVRAVALNTLKEIAPDIWQQAHEDMDGTNTAPKMQRH